MQLFNLFDGFHNSLNKLSLKYHMAFDMDVTDVNTVLIHTQLMHQKKKATHGIIMTLKQDYCSHNSFE